jgi:prolyl-tRNA synthetase
MAHEGEVLQLTGAQPGSCGPVGLKIKTYCDNGLKSLSDWIVGANVDGFHLKNINPGKDFTPTAWADLRKAKPGEPCPECGGALEAHRGIEVGHVFYLGTKYSESMGAQFLDEAGKSHPCEMGCYGIGVSRTMQAAIEQSNDKDGAIWPFAIAPFQVILCLLDVTDPATKSAADSIYEGLTAAGVDVLYDDRDERAGVKFKDADLLGIPLRINVGKRSLAEGGQVELVERKTKTAQKVVASDAVAEIIKWIKIQTEKSS